MSKRRAELEEESQKETAVWKDEDDDDLTIAVPQKVKKTFKVDLKRITDEDDKELDSKQYIGRLQEAFRRRHGGVPKWAQKIEENHDEDSLLTSAAGYIEKDAKLPKTTIKTTLLKDFNIGRRKKHSINALKFHKMRPVLITADSSGTVQLYKVGLEARQDHFLQSAQFGKFPIDCMEIAQTGHAVICSSSLQEYLMQYNMETTKVTQLRLPKSVPKGGISKFNISYDSEFLAIAGQNSHVYILQATTMEHIKTISLPSNAKTIKFFPGVTREIWIQCENGQIVMADILATSQHTFADEGTIHGTCMAISNSGDYFATGNDTGIVNVYDGATCRNTENPAPLFHVDNLVTAISSIAISSDAQYMAIASDVKDNQIRLVHMQSQTTFKNFPDRFGKVSKAKCVDISPRGGFVAVGNGDGKLHLFNIHHFSDY
ncbi:unnamed protein product [Caenorhabditis bovis]|uniref:Uncharacterized protein n=1 Tax=Caenorhabditis bovis TaxID=2654633 RepID=A0A8S1ET09_9PELO|nr:unnamed protein product [Caenorhabditis bovis]